MFFHDFICWLDAIISRLNANSGAVIAVFTAVLALFTGILAAATIFLWRVTRNAMTETERAFVFLDGFGENLITKADNYTEVIPRIPDYYLLITHLWVQPKWKNGGNTPTVDLTIQAALTLPYKDEEVQYVYPKDPVPFVIGPGASEPGHRIEMTGAAMTILKARAELEPDNAEAPLWAKKLILVFGRAEYSDVFGRRHFTEWCYQVEFFVDRDKYLHTLFTQYGPYNRTGTISTGWIARIRKKVSSWTCRRICRSAT